MGANGGRRPAPKARAEGAPLEKNGLFACRRRIFQGKNSIHVGRLRRAHSPQRGGRLRRSPVSTPTLTRRAPSAHPASLGGRLRRIATSRHCPSRCLRSTAAHEASCMRTHADASRHLLDSDTYAWQCVLRQLVSAEVSAWWLLHLYSCPGQNEHPPIPRSKRTPSNPQVHPRSAGHGWDLCSALHPM